MTCYCVGIGNRKIGTPVRETSNPCRSTDSGITSWTLRSREDVEITCVQ
jgi:hypothetical protein